MKKSLGIFFASLIIIGGLSAVSFAQTGHYHGWYKKNINKRQENQQDRISKGIADGQLTPKEAARLENQEARINRIEARDRKSGGGLSLRERGQLERDLNRESHRIYRQKHDRQHGF